MGLLVGSALVTAAAPSVAQETVVSREVTDEEVIGGPDKRTSEGRNSLPGVDRVFHAESMVRFAAASVSVGYGYTGAVLGDEDTHHRAVSTFGASIRPLKWLAFSLQYDARFDQHGGLASITGGEDSDDGFLAELRLGTRAVYEINPKLNLGLQAIVWFPPGGEPPSAALRATSVETSAAATLKPVPNLWLSANLGFRVDRSSESVDNADTLSSADRLALGVSDFNSVISGIGATYRIGEDVDLIGELTLQNLIGSGSPSISESPIGIVGGIRYRPSNSLQLALMAGGSPSSVENFGMTGPLFPVDPSFSTTFTVSYSHPLPRRKRITITKREPQFGGLGGKVTDEGGNPIAGATITITPQPADDNPVSDAEREPRTLTSDENGDFRDDRLPVGKAKVTIEIDGYQPREEVIDIGVGGVANLDTPLLEVLPPGQLRGIVQSERGSPLEATIRVEPGGKEAKASPTDGSFELDLEPGDYTVTISKAGFKEQTLTVSIPKGTVVIRNVNLRK